MSARPIPAWSKRARELLEHADSGNLILPATTVSHPPIDRNCPRAIYLGFECYEAKRAHWFIYIPSIITDNIGKIIQVTGNPHTGFGFQVKLNYHMIDPTTSSTTHYLELGTIPGSLVTDDYIPKPGFDQPIRNEPIDDIEEIAFNMGLPYRDSNATLPHIDDPIWLQSLPEFERCQEWTRKLVKKLVELGHFSNTAIDVVASATSVGL